MRAPRAAPCSYVSFATVVLARLGGALIRHAEPSATARLDQHEVAARETQADLAADVARPRRAGVQRDAVRQPVAAAVHAPRRHHAPVEHARERHLRRHHAVRAPEAQTAALLAVAAGTA